MILNLLRKTPDVDLAEAKQNAYFVEEDRSLLYSCFKKNISICEIGVQQGDNALNLYNAIKPKKLYLIDSWKVHSWEWLKEKNNFTDELIKEYKITLKNWHADADIENPDKTYQYFYEGVLERFQGKDNVKVIRKFSEDAVDDIPDNSIDLLYVDGNHTYDYVYRDLTLYEKKVSSEGIIMGNDFLKSNKDPFLTHYEVIEAVLDFCKAKPEWHIFLINNNAYADFILSRNVKFDYNFLKAMKKQKFKLRKLDDKKLGEFLLISDEINFSKIPNDLF